MSINASSTFSSSNLNPNPALLSSSISGTPGNDQISAQADGDTVSGLDGNDTLGGAGHSFVHLDGGGGADVIDLGGGEAVSADGGDGNDTIYGFATDGEVFGGAGNDRILVSDYTHADGGIGDDVLVCSSDGSANGGDGNDILFGYIDDTVAGDGGNDILFAQHAASGGAGADVVVGTDDDASLDGGDNNDVLFSNFVVTMFGGRGADMLYGSGQLHGGDGNDRLFGNGELYGDGGSDRLAGGAGDDLLNGGSGDDLLNGGGGNDVLTGGVGRDTFIFGPDAGHDTITDFSVGQDRIDLSAFGFASKGAVLAKATQVGTDAVLHLGQGEDVTIQHTSVKDLAKATFILHGGENIQDTSAVQAAMSAAFAKVEAHASDFEVLHNLSQAPWIPPILPELPWDNGAATVTAHADVVDHHHGGDGFMS